MRIRTFARNALVGLASALSVVVACASGPYAFIYVPTVVGVPADPGPAAFESFLDGRGYATDLISMSAIDTTDFSGYKKIIIGDNTGSFNVWGTATEVTALVAANKPFVAVGEGGYAFLGQLGAPSGWPNGWHGPQTTWFLPNPLHAVFAGPNVVTPDASGNVQITNGNSNQVGIYKTQLSATTLGLGREAQVPNDPVPDHYGLMLQDNRDFLWGFSADPTGFTTAGQDLFINVLAFPPVPEPDTWALMLVGLVGLGAIARRSR